MDLEELINEQRHRIPSLKYNSQTFRPYYSYEGVTKEEYLKWGEKTKRYLEQHFQDDKHIEDFINLYEASKTTPNQQQKLLAILEAFLELPNVIKKDVKVQQTKGINIQNNISNTNTQSQKQSQQQTIEILIKALEDQLTISQVKEIKQVVAEEKGNLEKAKPKVIDKVKAFGENVASNILANIITNPIIWEQFG